jgi:hypothetical protein
MAQQQKKPPMSIDDIETGEKNKTEERQPGRLSYVEGQNRDEGGGRGGGGGDNRPRLPFRGGGGKGGSPTIPLIIGIISILVSIFFTYNFAVSKASYNTLAKDYDTFVKATDTSLKGYASSADLAKERGRIDTLVNASAQYAKTADLSNKYASSDTVTALTGRVTTLEELSKKVGDLTTKVDGDVSVLDSLKKTVEDSLKIISDQAARLTKLEAAGNQSVVTPIPTDAIQVTLVNYFGGQTYLTFPSTNTTATGTFTLRLQNKTSSEITSIQLAIGLWTFSDLGATPVQSTGVLISSAGLTWTKAETSVTGLLGFINSGATSGPFGTFGDLILTALGQKDVTITVSVPAQAPLNIYPVIRVVSYK